MEKPAALKLETADGRLNANLTGDWTAYDTLDKNGKQGSGTETARLR